jgi:hypothetical protein
MSMPQMITIMITYILFGCQNVTKAGQTISTDIKKSITKDSPEVLRDCIRKSIDLYSIKKPMYAQDTLKNIIEQYEELEFEEVTSDVSNFYRFFQIKNVKSLENIVFIEPKIWLVGLTNSKLDATLEYEGENTKITFQIALINGSKDWTNSKNIKLDMENSNFLEPFSIEPSFLNRLEETKDSYIMSHAALQQDLEKKLNKTIILKTLPLKIEAIKLDGINGIVARKSESRESFIEKRLRILLKKGTTPDQINHLNIPYNGSRFIGGIDPDGDDTFGETSPAIYNVHLESELQINTFNNAYVHIPTNIINKYFNDVKYVKAVYRMNQNEEILPQVGLGFCSILKAQGKIEFKDRFQKNYLTIDFSKTSSKENQDFQAWKPILKDLCEEKNIDVNQIPWEIIEEGYFSEKDTLNLMWDEIISKEVPKFQIRGRFALIQSPNRFNELHDAFDQKERGTISENDFLSIKKSFDLKIRVEPHKFPEISDMYTNLVKQIFFHDNPKNRYYYRLDVNTSFTYKRFIFDWNPIRPTRLPNGALYDPSSAQ